MDFTYILLLVTVAVALFSRRQLLLEACIGVTYLVGWMVGLVESPAGWLLLIYWALANIYFRMDMDKIWRVLLFTAVVAFTAAFLLHWVPGIHNAFVINQVSLSTASIPFSMYLNFDKVFVALILFATSGLVKQERWLDWDALKQTGLILTLCIATIMVPAFALGYITYDPKFPDVLLLWAVNNFFFVCFAEEVIFRGFLQNTLKKVLQPITQNVYLPIGITSVIFGLAHFQGGVSLMVLATIAGFFYGYAYHKTGRILCAMLVHFGLNLFHLLVFAYPAAVMIK